jgi:hypothetical protein
VESPLSRALGRGRATIVECTLLLTSSACGRIRYDLVDASSASLDASSPDAASGDARVDAGPDAVSDSGEGAFDSGEDAFVRETCFPEAASWRDVGRGTADSPFLICNGTQWDSFAVDGDPTAVYRLESDLSITTVRASFGGTFDGGGHTLSGGALSASVFGTVSAAVLRNLRFELGVAPGPSVDQVGVVASSGSATTFEGLVVRVVGAVVWGGTQVGGIVGACTDCVFRDDAVSIDRMIGDSEIGLIAGSLTGGRVQNVTVVSTQLEARGVAAGRCTYMGGLVGSAVSGVILEECDVSVQLLSRGAGGHGGAVGILAASSILRDVRVRGSVPSLPPGMSCDSAIGGAVGALSSAIVQRVQVEADVSTVAGIAGDFTSGSVVDSVVVGPHLGFAQTFFLRCVETRGASGTDLHYFDDGTLPVPGGVGCPLVDSGHADLGYFNDNANEPLVRWDFTTVWATGPIGGLPSLRRTPGAP